MGRGDWWWFPEYDAPLGYPKGPARKNADGTWRRAFDRGAVIVNGSAYDAVVRMKGNYRDLSSGRVARRFMVPILDGRILLPTSDPPGGEDQPPRVTAEPPQTIRVAALDGGLHAVQTPGGLDLRVADDGTLRNILWHGKTLVDHRKWNTEEFLLAGYPISGEVKAGSTWSFRIRTSVHSARMTLHRMEHSLYLVPRGGCLENLVRLRGGVVEQGHEHIAIPVRQPRDMMLFDDAAGCPGKGRDGKVAHRLAQAGRRLLDGRLHSQRTHRGNALRESRTEITSQRQLSDRNHQ